MTKTASLTSSLVAKKGQAVPAVTHQVQQQELPVAAKVSGPDYYKALTVKLDRQRYAALKALGVRLDKKSQEIFVEALDLYLRNNPKQA